MISGGAPFSDIPINRQLLGYRTIQPTHHHPCYHKFANKTIQKLKSTQ